ncbi:MAG: hypothetical protein LCH41_09720 [Armatimonadetes bacterium]|nr:hypothetical protein [Armatimonadota bacterium]
MRVNFRWVWLLCLPLPLAAKAQFTLSDPGSADKPSQTVLTGRSAYDLIRLSPDRFSFSLRYGNVIERSETVVLDGRTLVRDQDYTMEYASGSVYIKIPIKQGQSLRVSYRYDETKSREGIYGGATSGAGNGFAFNLSPGAKAWMGMGYTERLADGTILSGNIFGLSNSFSFSGGSMKGLFMVNDRKKVDASSLTGEYEGSKGTEDGQGRAIVQELQSGFLGGSIKVSYQDIEDKFAGFHSFSGAGYDAKAIQMFQNEKGLKRSAFSMTNLGSKAFNFGGGYATVGDDKGQITWRNASLGFGSTKIDYSSQYVDPGFNKFNGLREEDRAQLVKEKGLARQAFSLKSPSKGGTLSYNFLNVESGKEGLWRSGWAWDSPTLKASWFRQSVDSKFVRFNDLREGDRGQLAKERGLDRNMFSLSANPAKLGFSLNTSEIRTDKQEGWMTRDFGLTGQGWNFSYSSRDVSDQFGAFYSLTGEDRTKFVGGIAGVLGAAPHGDDIRMIDQNGLDREGWRLNTDRKGWKSSFSRFTIDQKTGQLSYNEFVTEKGPTKLRVMSQNADDGFGAMNRLTATEQMRLGNVDGLDKQDIDLSTTVGKKSNLVLQWMNASDPHGSALRRQLKFDQPGLSLSYTRRAVDEGFNAVGRMVDTERELLQSMLGFDHAEVIGAWDVMPGMKAEFRKLDATSAFLGQSVAAQSGAFAWSLSPKTQLWFRTSSTKIDEGDTSPVDTTYQGMSVSHDLGTAGKVTVTQEAHKFDGSSETLPDATRQAVAYEKKIDDKTSIRTEQSETRFGDGTRETTSANTIATQISPRVGVSVTDSTVRRDGDKPDEKHRNYGFWVDFGRGIRLDYGYVRNMHGENGTLNTQTSLSGGEAQGIKLDGARYQLNRWDGQRSQHFGNVSFSNLKPFQFGFVKDVKFYYRSDTQRDYLSWQRENTDLGLSAAIGSFGLAWDYKAQIHSSGIRAIDRTFTLTTDRNNKAPLRAVLKYGVRTMPDNKDVMIRDYSLSYRATRNFSVEHSLVTNPTQQRGNVLLGSVNLDERKSSWTAKYQNDPRMAFDLNWSEIKRDNKGESLRREARMNMTLFANNASPLQLTYALQEWDRGANSSLAHSYGVTFNQRPGANQSLSFSLERLQWGAGRPDDSRLRDWSLRLDYNLRF